MGRHYATTRAGRMVAVFLDLTMHNLITDLPGLRVGAAQDERVASGASVLVFDEPAVASIAAHGGAPALRDGALLEPEMTVEKIDALVLSGGSAFGLDAAGGAMAWLAENGRGFPVGPVRVPIVPGASLFDLLNGGDKDWGRQPPYWRLGYEAAAGAAREFALGSAGAGYGATTCDLNGGLGSTSAVSSRGFLVGALVAVNSVGRATRGSGPHFWAAPYERGDEFGGLGDPDKAPADALDMRLKHDAPANTTIAIVATDAAFSKAQMKRVAIMAQDGIGLALRPAHAPMDGDIVFAATTARATLAPDLRDLAEIGMLAAECLARAIARGVYEASPGAHGARPPCWRERYGGALSRTAPLGKGKGP
jgi:D-aminopeptidase